MVFFYFSICIINLRWEGRWIGSCKLILTLWFTHCISELEPWCVWWRLVLEHHKTGVYRAPRCSSMHPFGDCFHQSDTLLFFSSLIVFAELHVPLLTPSIYLFFPNTSVVAAIRSGAANIALAQLGQKVSWNRRT